MDTSEPSSKIEIEKDPGGAKPETRLHGQHCFFVVKGPDLDTVYATARALGVKVLEAKRLRDNVPGVTVDKEVEVEDPADKTKTVKKSVKVLADMQTGVYRKIADAPANVGVGRRTAPGLKLEEVVETEFTYVVKAMGNPTETLT